VVKREGVFEKNFYFTLRLPAILTEITAHLKLAPAPAFARRRAGKGTAKAV